MIALVALAAPPSLAANETLLAAQQTVPDTPETLAADQATLLALGQTQSRLTVPVTIGGSPPYHFIIDTGAERTVVSRELAHVLHLKAGPNVNLTAVTGTQLVRTVEVPEIAVTPLAGNAIIAPELEAQHIGAPGILGIDMLQDHKVSIDFAKNVMAVLPSKRRAHSYASAAPNEVVVRARDMFGQLIVTEARYGGRPIRVIVDTGAAVTVANSAFARLMRKTKDGHIIPVESVTGNTLYMNYGMVNGVSIGGVGLNGLPVAIADIAPFKKFGVESTPALLLGMDAMRAFRDVTIDFANREIRFTMPDGAITPELGRWSVAPS